MDKVWLEQYQTGVPYEIDSSEYSSLVALFEDSCRQYSKQIAYVNLDCELSYRELEIKSRQFAIYLQQLGLKKGTRIALMMPNLLQYPIALFATLRAGYVIVNTNPLYTLDEVVHQMNDSGAEVIVVLANFAKTVEKALEHMPTIKHVIITQIGDIFPPVKRVIVNAVVKYIKKWFPSTAFLMQFALMTH
nr:AMP-binding protein [Legionella tunisiensis]